MFSMGDKKRQDLEALTKDADQRIRILEEKYLFQEQTIDDLHEVILEQQNQLNSLEEQVSRLRALLYALQADPDEGDDPPPPHY